ncbi:MAG: dihydropteroate synthase [Alphaproteobacteria bacterium]|nr:dihydropteroate synthase [Alphaproteobacteria bacterium]
MSSPIQDLSPPPTPDRVPAFAGLAMSGEAAQPVVMGIVNVTPDSFSDGGDSFATEAAIAHGRSHAAAGAHILDIGGESTRPGAAPISADEECARVIPVVVALATDGYLVSIDTRRAAVMAAALDAGAAIVNDVSALTDDAASLATVAGTGSCVVLMHKQGAPATMQKGPAYGHAVTEIYDYLGRRIDACDAAGIARARISVDPGIGFCKTIQHNIDLITQLGVFHGLGVPLTVGLSRKSFISDIAPDAHPNADPKNRLAGSIAAALAALERGAQILRVHDVAETVQAIAVWRALRGNF